MKLEEGMYVRTKKGMMAKIISKEDVSGSLHKEEIVFILDNGNRLALNSRKVIKARYNIIDLIEEGDYVNGYKIDYINSKCETPFLRSNQPYRVDNTLYSTLIEKGKDYNQPLHFYNEDIKSIVTKEQFESMKYEVK